MADITLLIRRLLLVFKGKPQTLSMTNELLPSTDREVAEYWTRHNVSNHRLFSSRADSLEYFHWRCDQYPGYIDLMPVSGFEGKAVLDFGCGPGHDIVGFLEYSQPALLVAAEVSSASIAEAKARAEFHRTESQKMDFILLDPAASTLPFEDDSFDYIHSSGVLHHVPDVKATLTELRRILKPSGRARVMVYNRASIWLHLYVAYQKRWKDRSISTDLPLLRAFSMSTDGPDCPIANCYTGDEFVALCSSVGLGAKVVGVACSLFEMELVHTLRYEACMSQNLEREHREFLLGLQFDSSGRPLDNGKIAGIDLVLELTRD